jgi:hypothetical protein
LSRKYSRGGPHCKDYIKQKTKTVQRSLRREEKQKKTPNNKPKKTILRHLNTTSILDAFAH